MKLTETNVKTITSKYISWVNTHKQGRWISIHSNEYQRKVNKKVPFYY